jgi:hypothetical protein
VTTHVVPDGTVVKIYREWAQDWRGLWAKVKPRATVARVVVVDAIGEYDCIAVVGSPRVRRVYQRWFDDLHAACAAGGERRFRRKRPSPRVAAAAERRQRRAMGRTERRKRRRERRARRTS